MNTVRNSKRDALRKIHQVSVYAMVSAMVSVFFFFLLPKNKPSFCLIGWNERTCGTACAPEHEKSWMSVVCLFPPMNPAYIACLSMWLAEMRVCEIGT